MLDGIYARGALRSRLVATLSCASPQQLSGWHRSGLIVATTSPGGRGFRRLYSWIEYLKVRAAVKLLEQHLPRHRLRPNLLRLERELPEWYRLPLLAHQSQVIVPTTDGKGYTVIDRQLAHADFIGSAGLRGAVAEDIDFDLAITAVREIQAEGPLGSLGRFDDYVTMDPAVMGGNPVVVETRLETAMIAAIHAKGFQEISEIAERFDLTESAVRAAVDFEHEVSAERAPRALSA